MDILNLVIGLFLIGIGFLVKVAPDLIAGYNTMPEEKKRKVDVKALSTFLRNGFIAMGASIIAGYFLFKWLGFPLIANSMILIVTLLGSTILVIRAQRFDRNKRKNTKMIYIILASAFIFVAAITTFGLIPAKAHIEDNSVRFSGMYGLEINYADIGKVILADSMPPILMRANGFSFAGVHKGYYDLEGYGRSRLLLHTNRSPFIIITKKSGGITVVNFRDRNETETTYNSIRTLLHR